MWLWRSYSWPHTRPIRRVISLIFQRTKKNTNFFKACCSAIGHITPKGSSVRTESSAYASRIDSKPTFNPRPTGTPDFPPPTGGGGFEHLSRLLLVVEKNGNNVRKLVKNDYETISVNFSLKSKLWPPGSKWPNCRIFHDCQTSFRKTSIISGTIMARENPKTAFERELNSSSLGFRQIWPKVNGLASRGHRSQKSCFWAKSLTANNFFILYVQQ